MFDWDLFIWAIGLMVVMPAVLVTIVICCSRHWSSVNQAIIFKDKLDAGTGGTTTPTDATASTALNTDADSGLDSSPTTTSPSGEAQANVSSTGPKAITSSKRENTAAAQVPVAPSPAAIPTISAKPLTVPKSAKKSFKTPKSATSKKEAVPGTTTSTKAEPANAPQLALSVKKEKSPVSRSSKPKSIAAPTRKGTATGTVVSGVAPMPTLAQAQTTAPVSTSGGTPQAGEGSSKKPPLTPTPALAPPDGPNGGGK